MQVEFWCEGCQNYRDGDFFHVKVSVKRFSEKGKQGIGRREKHWIHDYGAQWCEDCIAAKIGLLTNNNEIKRRLSVLTSKD